MTTVFQQLLGNKSAAAHMAAGRLRNFIIGFTAVMTVSAFSAGPARADFTVCNHAYWPIFVSLAYNDKDKGWVTFGWWQVQRGACDVLIAGSVQGRNIYAWATGPRGNGGWAWWGDVGEKGSEKLCTPKPEDSHFTIYHNEIRGSCKDAGYVERGFRKFHNGGSADGRANYYPDLPLVVEEERVLKPKDPFWECGGCPVMVVVPPGEFLMGSPEKEPERAGAEGPRHKVNFRQRFAVSKGPVTRDQFERFVNATGHKLGDHCLTRKDGKWVPEAGRSFKDPGFAQAGNHPAVCVSFEDAKAYVAWLSKHTGRSYRLLSEAEWEYVARAGSDTPFWWGSTITPAHANYNGNIVYPGGSKGEFRQKTVPASDSFKVNPWNLFIGTGNAAEWVEDCWNKNYQDAPPEGSAWSKGECGSHVVRGGSWTSDPAVLRSAARLAVESSLRSSDVGFRVARPMAP